MTAASGKHAPRRTGQPGVQHKIAGHWLGKTSAGLVCGFVLALLASGLLIRLAPGVPGQTGRAEALMLFIPVIWVALFSAAFLFRTGWHAWSRLGAACLLAYAAVQLCGAVHA